MTVNTYNIKRLAHNLSRSSTDQTWNPFRHVAWNQSRRGTWAPDRNDRDLEAHGEGSRLSHAATAPQQRTHSAATDPNQDPELTQVAEEKSIGNDHTAANGVAGANTAGVRNRKPDNGPSRAVGNNQEEDDDDSKSKKKAKTNALYRPVHPRHPFTLANQLQRTFLSSWINVLLFAAPVGIALNYVKSVSPTVVFVVNFIAIIPLAAMLSYATEEIALRTGETLGGLINATFGNAVELIVAIIALIKGEIVVVQTSLIGSILSNLLLVMGFCFFFGGLRRTEQHFNTTVAQTAASLLALAVASVIVPTVFELKTNAEQTEIAKLSRGTAVILLLVYFAYLFFQLHTHLDVFNEQSQKVAARPWTHGQSIKEGFSHMPGASALMRHGQASSSQEEQNLAAVPLEDRNLPQEEEEDDDESEDPQLHFFVAIATLLISTVIIALCAEFMVDSIDHLTETTALRKEFVGLILLPIVGNAAEHATAVTVAVKDKMDLAIGVAVGSSMQVALFLIPLLVIIGWGLGNKYMDLSLDEFQVAVMFVAVLLTNYLIGDGKSHWLEGFLLICLYAIIATCTFFYPDSGDGRTG